MSAVRNTLRRTLDAIESGKQHNWVALHVGVGAMGDPNPGTSLYNGSTFMVTFRGFDHKAGGWTLEAFASDNGHVAWETFTPQQVRATFKAFGLDPDVEMKRLMEYWA